MILIICFLTFSTIVLWLEGSRQKFSIGQFFFLGGGSIFSSLIFELERYFLK